MTSHCRVGKIPFHIQMQLGLRLDTAATYLCALILLAAAAALAWNWRLFPDTILTRSVPIQGLTLAQRLNIERAANALDGCTIAPGARFSFNATVGPRTESRGYLPAPAYVGTRTETSVGGGVCLVSSMVYQLALQCGLKIDERTAHSRTIKTVAPGLDATVWYGRCDLSFTNTSSSPLQIKTESDGRSIRLDLKGNSANLPIYTIQQRCEQLNKDTLCVDVTRKHGDRLQLVSHDTYTINRHNSPSLPRED